MAWVAGVDGCPRGWFRASCEIDTGALDFVLVEHAAGLLERAPSPVVVAIDIPIGLPDRGSRSCDVEARKRLGPRRSSVFPAPIRAAVRARDREEASRITFAADGRKVAAQAFGIFPKVAEVDALLGSDAEARECFHEVHPELSFGAWNGGVPLADAKKTEAGRSARLALAEAWLGGGILERARGTTLKKDLAADDILDAIAALWTAARIHRAAATTIPEVPPRDARNLPMRIVF